MNKTTIALFAILALLPAGCRLGGIRGNGNIVTDQRTVGDFSEIEASGALQIEWRNGPPSLSITTDQNLLSHIDDQLTGKRLRLRSHGDMWPTQRIKVAISSPARVGAKLSGATRLTATALSGAKFAVESSGATNLTLDGNIDQLLVDMTGASKLNAESLKTKIAELSTTGAANAHVAVSDTLKVSITGAGKVTYSGNPATIQKSVTGAGSIHHKD
jgi:hypothetical protein